MAQKSQLGSVPRHQHLQLRAGASSRHTASTAAATLHWSAQKWHSPSAQQHGTIAGLETEAQDEVSQLRLNLEPDQTQSSC